MGRIRTIKPEFTQDEELSALPCETHLFAAGLLCYADDFGYFNANAGLARAAVFPLRELSRTIPEMFGDLVKIGYLRLGTAPDGKRFGHIINFDRHQRVSHPTPSKISDLGIAWDDSGNYPEASRTFPNVSALNREQGTGKGTGNREKETSPSAPAGEPADSPPAGDPSRGKNDEKVEKAAIGRLFTFYCETLGRSPARYTLTAAREKKALARLRERRRAHGGELQAAERDLAQAIENLAASEWHRGAGHIDWLEQIFRSAEEFERRLNWTSPTVGEKQHGNSSESWLDGQQREAERILAARTSEHPGPQAQRSS
jgi:hypothetical protein